VSALRHNPLAAHVMYFDPRCSAWVGADGPETECLYNPSTRWGRVEYQLFVLAVFYISERHFGAPHSVMGP